MSDAMFRVRQDGSAGGDREALGAAAAALIATLSVTRGTTFLRTGIVMAGLLLSAGLVVPAVAETHVAQDTSTDRDDRGFDKWGPHKGPRRVLSSRPPFAELEFWS